jgi:hypothetical protein
MVGPTSQVSLLIRMAVQSSTDGIYIDFAGECAHNPCTYYELATVQWGRGTLTNQIMVQPVVM